MKFETLILASILPLTSIANTSASIECYKQAAADKLVLTQYKKDAAPFSTDGHYSQLYTLALESRLTSLCHGATSATEPINCYKEAFTNKDILVEFKKAAIPFNTDGSYSRTNELALEDSLIDLCSNK